MKKRVKGLWFVLLSLMPVLTPHHVVAQAIEDLNPSVVKIVAKVLGKTKMGTGIIIRIESDSAYIVTASHVVEGDPNPKIEFYTQRNRYVSSRIVGMEGGDNRGLAALLVEGEFPDGINPIPLNTQLEVKPGDAVTLIGFPRMAGVPWAVTKGETVGRKGRDLVFSGAVDEGSSGGPLLKNHQLIGIVSEVGSPFAYAVPSLIARYALESWGVSFGLHLRSEPATVLAQHVVHMLKANRFHHPPDFSDKGYSGFVMGSIEHAFSTHTAQEAAVVIDHGTGLMWQRDGSNAEMDFEDAEAYLKSLNTKKMAGFSDWRLPTVEELASLIEPVGVNDNLFIDRQFSSLQSSCWTGDRKQNPILFLWVVDFRQGGIYSDSWRSQYYVRAVRSLENNTAFP